MVTVPGGFNISNQPILSRHGRVHHNWLDGIFSAADAEREAEYAAIQTAPGMRAKQLALQERINKSFGPFPERVPLNAQITNTLDRSANGYMVDNVVFDSLHLDGDPDRALKIPANFYRPTTGLPAPGVVIACGHDTRSKQHYQDFANSLVKLGFCALIYDCIGQGERLQLPSSSPGAEHIAIGQQMILGGWSLPGLMAWDGSRAIDYLFSRDDVVNTDYIGVTGTSGGGTQTVWTAAIDDRVNMMAPSCFVTGFHDNFRNEIHADHEQMPIGISPLEIVECLIPRLKAGVGIVLIGQIRDYFARRGLRWSYYLLRRCADLLGLPAEAVRLYIGPSDHLLSVPGREEAYKTFDYVVGGPSGHGGKGVDELPLTNESDTPPTLEQQVSFPLEWSGPNITLDCAPNRDVGELPGSIRIGELNAHLADKCAVVRGSPTGDVLKARIRDFLKIPEGRRPVPELLGTKEHTTLWSNSGSVPAPNYPKTHACVYDIATVPAKVEHGVPIPAVVVPVTYVNTGTWHSEPPETSEGTRAILYIPHAGQDTELARATREPLITSTILAEPNTPFFSMDLRGIGELKPLANTSNNEEMYAKTSELIGLNMLGQQVWDILRVLDFLGAYGYTSVFLIARGFGTPAGSLAALLDDRVSQVTLKNSLSRYEAILGVHPRDNAWPPRVVPFDILNHFDMPAVYTALASKNLVQVTPWGASGAAGNF